MPRTGQTAEHRHGGPGSIAAMHRLLATLLTSTMLAQTPAVNPEPELGTVHWSRDFAAALARAGKEQKPVFLLFQEIPGCATCTGFGKDVLSSPLLVAAIEASFVPVVVRNNVDGREKEILQRYEEPAWNNPVVRFVDAQGQDLLPRKDGVWDAHGIASRMVQALEKQQRPVPGFLTIARNESDPKTAKAVFSMHCFWEGEAVLGALPGVVSTRAAFVGEAEVVEVTFLPAVVSLSKLTEHAQQKSCKPVVGGTLRQAPASDQQHALPGTPYARLELSPMQRMKVHSSLTLGTDPNAWLTTLQIAAAAKQPVKKC